MTEQGPDIIGQESARRYQAHKEKVKEELLAEKDVNRAQDIDMEVRWENLQGKGSKMITQEEAKEAVKVSQEELDLSHQATKAQLEQTRGWKDNNLEALVDSASNDERATKTE